MTAETEDMQENSADSPAQAQFRRRVRDWCAEHIPRDWRQTQTGATDDEFVAFQKAWFAELHSAGFAVPHWPREWGGGMSVGRAGGALPGVGRTRRTAVGARVRRHPPRRLDAAGRRNRRAAPTPPARDPRRRDLGAGLLRTGGRIRPGEPAHHAHAGTATTTSSTARSCGPAAVCTPTGACCSPAPIPTRPNARAFRTSCWTWRTPGVEVRPIRNAIGDSHFCEVFLNDVDDPGRQPRRRGERGMAGGTGDAGRRAGHDDARARRAARQRRLPLAGRGGSASRTRSSPTAWRSSRSRSPACADCAGSWWRTTRPAGEPGRRLHRQALLQRAASADDGFRRGDRRAGRPHRVGQADVERLGVRRLDARLHRVVGVDDPRRRERDPAHHHRRARPGPAAGTERASDGPRFSEFHDELRSVAGDLLAKDRAVDWPVLVDAGWVGLEVPEQFGGAGATFAETAVVCEEMGRAASANSYLGSAVLAVGTLKALQPSDTRDRTA